MSHESRPSRTALFFTAAYVLVWFASLIDWKWGRSLPDWWLWFCFLSSVPLGAAWLKWIVRACPGNQLRLALTASCVYVLWWQLAVYAFDALGWEWLRASVARIGTGGLFVLGLAWVVWGLERASQYYEWLRMNQRPGSARDAAREPVRTPADRRAEETSNKRIWNPLDSEAWYYGRRSRKLNQSVTGFLAYTFSFLLAFLILTHLGGCQEIYEMPAGGGEQQPIAQTVKIEKIIRKKFVINPFSAISFKIPPIDEVQLQLTEITKHAYTVGYGQGTGAGFAGGTKQGKVRFIRLQYNGGDWDQDFGIGADLNMLIEYGIRTSQPVADKTESRRVTELQNFPVGKSPPFVYMTGQRSITLSNNEVKILREYLLEKHGMIFADNGGSMHFHNQFVSMMQSVLPNVRPVPVPLDDVIHRLPYRLPFLPYVAPHGGKEALGWKVDGRWVCYYHPGDIHDAWSDDHAGVKPEIWEACYQLGTNIIFYAHTEYSKWLEARKENP